MSLLVLERGVEEEEVGEERGVDEGFEGVVREGGMEMVRGEFEAGLGIVGVRKEEVRILGGLVRGVLSVWSHWVDASENCGFLLVRELL